ncbi:helix-turn-helix transcriptional regulator [Trinickia sp. EG282A]|uniref:helix-turn-helix transcriptional regulator n=1 Tax=Trinickia sp. EG282A TaxID=3237013 RepID=UPI0034D32EEF
MQKVHFLYGRQSGHVLVRGAAHAIAAHSIAVACGDAAICGTDAANELHEINVGSVDFQRLYPDIADLLDTTIPLRFVPEPVRIVAASPGVVETLMLLADAAPQMLLRFVYAYCLALDRAYFSALARYAMAGDVALIEFIEANYLKQWSVERYAHEFGMPSRKFDMLFREKYGMSPKRWLLEKRLTHAREMLQSTSMRVLDIALECGFANHAHFTDSFRKRFHCNPTQFRMSETRKLGLAQGAAA